MSNFIKLTFDINRDIRKMSEVIHRQTRFAEMEPHKIDEASLKKQVKVKKLLVEAADIIDPKKELNWNF